MCSEGAGKLKWGNAIGASEMLIERALIAETGCQCAFDERMTVLKLTTSGIQSDVNKIGMRGEADGPFEQFDQLKAGKSRNLGEVVQVQILRIMLLHQLDQVLEQLSVAWRGVGRSFPAAIASEQLAKRVHRKFISEQAIGVRFKCMMELAESLDQIAVIEHVPCEIGNGVDAKAASDIVDCRPGQIERAITPSLTISHAGGLAFLRIGYKQRGRADFLSDTSAADLGAASLGHGDDKRIVGVRTVVVTAEISA